MKPQFLLVALLTSVFATSIEAQNRTTINSMNSDISDNLDLRAVASIFGDSRNLQDFERRLNDPRLQISNLDLNYDNEVDYLRVIESVQKRTHVVIIQSVIDRDLYQDIATIEVDRDRFNNVNVQVVGNNYMYGNNYIFEPVFYDTPRIYASFWLSNYRPYCSSWSWNYYPSYYYSWNPFPVFRYRNNINNCLNTYNDYNYVNFRRSNLAINIYNSRSCNAYERQHLNNSFVRRNSNVNNRFELDQRRNSSTIGLKNNSPRIATQQRTETTRDNSQNRNDSPRVATQQRIETTRDNSQNRNDSPRVANQQRTETIRDNSQNRNDSPRVVTQQRTETTRDNSQNRNDSPRVANQQRTETTRDNSQNKNDSPRVANEQRTETTRDNSQNRNDSSRISSLQRAESSRSNSNEARDFSSREGNRRS